MTTSHAYLRPEWRDESVSPADDYYMYANGGWLRDNPIPKDKNTWGSFYEIQERNEQVLHALLSQSQDTDEAANRRVAKAYFQSGIDQDGIEAAGIRPLQGLMTAVDGLRHVSDLPSVVAQLHSCSVSVFFEADIMPDFESSTKTMLYFAQGGCGLPEKSYYGNTDESSKAIKSAYMAHIATQLKNYGYDAAHADSASAAIVAFESLLADASYSREQLRDVSLTMNKLPFKKAQQLLPSLSLSLFTKALGINTDVVGVNNPSFFKTLSAALATTPIDTLKEYCVWHIIRRYAFSLPSAFEGAAFDFYGKILSGQLEPEPRWKRVLSMASADIGDAVAEVFVGEVFSEDSKQRCEQLVNNLLGAMKKTITNLDWMSRDTKAAALKKLDNFGYKIGYPNTWRDYSKVRCDAKSPFCENRLNAIQHEVRRRIAMLHKPVNPSDWEMPAHTVNAYYHPLRNEIVFPAGILQPPLYYEDADDPVIYGAIGAVIGHEITHGFDDQGRRFDGDGNLRDWWTESDTREFIARSKVLVTQASEYEAVPGRYLNGQQTLGENIADLGGLRLALQALTIKKGSQPTKAESRRFFLSYATMWRMNYKPEVLDLLLTIDTHAPGQFRTNGPLSNVPEFAEAYDIAPPSPMSRESNAAARVW